MTTVFTMIIEGDLPGHFVWRDDTCVAFLSINPINRGHVLVVPRAEVDEWVDLDTETNQHLMAVAHHIASVQRGLYQPQRVGLIIAGFEVPHVHLHVIPMDSMADIDFANAATTVDHGDLAQIASDLAGALRAAGNDAAAI